MMRTMMIYIVEKKYNCYIFKEKQYIYNFFLKFKIFNFLKFNSLIFIIFMMKNLKIKIIIFEIDKLIYYYNFLQNLIERYKN